MNTKRFIVWSNMLFVIPFVFSMMFGMWSVAVIIALATVSSVVLHSYGGKRFLMADRLFGVCLIVLDIALSVLGHFVMPYFLCVLFFGCIAAYFYIQKRADIYNMNHGMWHIFLAIFTLFCLLTYRFGSM
jgi:hypothetical protein